MSLYYQANHIMTSGNLAVMAECLAYGIGWTWIALLMAEPLMTSELKNDFKLISLFFAIKNFRWSSDMNIMNHQPSTCGKSKATNSHKHVFPKAVIYSYLFHFLFLFYFYERCLFLLLSSSRNVWVMLPVLKIIKLILVRISFLFKSNAQICLHPILCFDKQNTPYHQ